MSNKDLHELITALVDNEVDGSEKSGLEEKIAHDPELGFIYNSQKDLKNVLSDKFSNITAPDLLYEKIKKDIYPETKEQREWRFQLFPSKIRKPQFILSFSFTIVITFVLLFNFLDTGDPTSLIEQQIGEDNMFVIANQNFSKILDGSLSLQFVSEDPAKLNEFFQKKGVHYNTVVQPCTTWLLKGGVVSKNHGENLAHHLYTSEDGHYIYIFQAGEDCFSKEKVLKLSPALLEFLEEGNFYKCQDNQYCTYIWKCKVTKNIFTLVSDVDDPRIVSNFIQASL